MGDTKLIPKFIGDLPRRNTSRYVFAHVCFSYVLIFSVSLLLGVMFFSYFSTDLIKSEALASKVIFHFSNVFKGCVSFKDYFTVITTAASPDLRLLFLLFASGFTYFCSVATYAFIICRGFTIGFSLRYLMLIGNTYFESSSVIFVFMLFELLSAALFLFLGTKSQIFAYDFRKLRGRKSRIITSPTIYFYMLLYLSSFGLVFIINASGCFTSLLLYGKGL